MVKPLMEQTPAILEDVSYATWYKFTEVCGSLACDEPEVQSYSSENQSSCAQVETDLC